MAWPNTGLARKIALLRPSIIFSKANHSEARLKAMIESANRRACQATLTPAMISLKFIHFKKVLNLIPVLTTFNSHPPRLAAHQWLYVRAASMRVRAGLGWQWQLRLSWMNINIEPPDRPQHSGRVRHLEDYGEIEFVVLSDHRLAEGEFVLGEVQLFEEIHFSKGKTCKWFLLRLFIFDRINNQINLPILWSICDGLHQSSE